MSKSLFLAAFLASPLAVQAAGDADLAAIRQQIAEMKKSYEARIAALETRLAEAETKQASTPAASPAPVAAQALPSGGGASAFNPEVSLILQGQYRHMKDVPERGITGFWPAAGHNHAGGVAPEARRGFTVDHTELVLAANIDPYWRGQAMLAAIDGSVEVEEAWFQSLALGGGLGLKGGRFRSGIAYLNEQHPHQWDFADAPLMYRALFGAHGSYAQDGVQFKWLAPTPVFLEFGAELGRGANFPGSDRNRNGSGAGALFVHVGDDVGVAHSWRAGLGYLRTRAENREGHLENLAGNEITGLFSGSSRTWLADFVWKWSPEGNARERNFKFQAEYFQRRESGEIGCTQDSAAPGSCILEGDAPVMLDSYRSRQSGWYAQGVYQFSPGWRVGLRHEQLSSGGTRVGANALLEVAEDHPVLARYRPKKSSAMVDYSWSEYSRLRLQYARDTSMAGVTDQQWTLQYIMSLGAHGAHKF